MLLGFDQRMMAAGAQGSHGLGGGADRLLQLGLFAAQVLQQFTVALGGPLILASLFQIADFIAKSVLFIHHGTNAPEFLIALIAAALLHNISLINLPLRAFSTVASNLGPKSTPICRARFFAHKPTLRESL